MAEKIKELPSKGSDESFQNLDLPVSETVNTPTLEMKFYILGCVVVIFAGIIFYKVFFATETCLNAKQIAMLKYLLPIVGGFLAWTILGKIQITTDKLIPGLMIAAGGGFAVYLLSSQIFDINNTSLNCNYRVILEDKLTDLGHELTNLHASFSDSKLQSSNRPQVNTAALNLLKKLEGLKQVEPGTRKVTYYNYLASTALMASMTYDLSTPEVDDAKKYAKKALLSAEEAIHEIETVKQSNDDASLKYFSDYQTEDKSLYYMGLSQVLLLQLASQGQQSIGINVTVGDIVDTFSKVDYKALQSWGLNTEGPVAWFCHEHSEEKKICGT